MHGLFLFALTSWWSLSKCPSCPAVDDVTVKLLVQQHDVSTSKCQLSNCYSFRACFPLKQDHHSDLIFEPLCICAPGPRFVPQLLLDSWRERCCLSEAHLSCEFDIIYSAMYLPSPLAWDLTLAMPLPVLGHLALKLCCISLDC